MCLPLGCTKTLVGLTALIITSTKLHLYTKNSIKIKIFIFYNKKKLEA